MNTQIAWPSAERQAQFERWVRSLDTCHGILLHTLEPASADASFRRYLRLQGAGRSLIVMDAPPPQEDVRPFVHVAGLIHAAGLHAPQVLHADVEHGFLLLEDLGTQVYLQALQAATPGQADALMRDALTALVRFQQGVPAAALPPLDERLLGAELDLFPTWCVQRECGVHWGAAELQAWDKVRSLLIRSALAQPVVAVHADWMPRNLMVAPDAARNPAILDFQDAMAGPVTYDLASLLRDAFLSWDEAQEIDWAVRWWQQARAAGLPVDADFGEFWRALEWMGLQRHLRVMGVFCRLKHRDGKDKYAADLPRFFGYANKVAMRYRPLAPLLRLLEPLSGTRVEAGFTF
ncbi:MAG: phosphotransferase [Rubrivivax sp.]|jgi:aminoglycoside/choline kinase family phosphotransferase|nr:phosphotransferase [Rubrivivax sp.]